MRPALLLVMLAAFCAAGAHAATDDRTGFGYCAPPYAPPCVDADGTYKTPKQLDVCKARVQAYVTLVAEYRSCLQRETERAILEVNAKLDRYKCRSASRKQPCPQK